ncbi:MAG: dihydrofolate reductase family protein [bacterium]
MRKLKLQTHVTVDGFAVSADGKEFLTGIDDEGVRASENHLIDTSDTILLGRNMTEGFVTYWEAAASKPDSPEYDFAQKMVRTPKIVFSHSLKTVKGQNIRVENGPLVEAVTQLKNEPGADILVYGGPTFVASLITNKLIDEYHLFVNPIAVGQGRGLFPQRTPLTLVTSVGHPRGIVVNTYTP